MATSTFDKRIVIRDNAMAQKVAKVLAYAPTACLSGKTAYSTDERKRSEALLARRLSRSENE